MSGPLTEGGGLRKNDALLGHSQIRTHPLIIYVKLHLRLEPRVVEWRRSYPRISIIMFAKRKNGGE